jgi:DNA adenine methylase
MIKPFIKWVGGKSSAITTISDFYPENIASIKNYCEPFIGGGAMFFHLASLYKFEKIIINDISPYLIKTYIAVRDRLENLIKILDYYQKSYLDLEIKEKEKLFYQFRDKFNNNDYYEEIELAAIFIFLNKTCFNGLFRLNSKGKLNSPFGFNKKPSFYNYKNIYQASSILQKADILYQDFYSLKDDIKNDFFIYLDPPYRPISKTSSFNGYFGNNFNDEQQKQLRDFVVDISSNKNKILISNSDDGSDFFAKLYNGFTINKIKVSRMVNSNANLRGKINELLISNYNKFLYKTNEQQSLEFDF